MLRTSGSPRSSSLFLIFLVLVALLLTMSMSPYAAVAQDDVTCCNSTDFDLFLMGDADDGTLTPFDEDLESDESDSQSTLVTPSILSEIKIGAWGVVWGTEGAYQNSTWEFSIPYEVEVADPSEADFRKLLGLQAELLGIEPNEEVFSHLITTHYTKADRPFRYCHPRDLILQVQNQCLFRETPFKLTREAFDEAAALYFTLL